jgi:hypothetical protein
MAKYSSAGGWNREGDSLHVQMKRDLGACGIFELSRFTQFVTRTVFSALLSKLGRRGLVAIYIRTPYKSRLFTRRMGIPSGRPSTYPYIHPFMQRRDRDICRSHIPIVL